MNNGDILVVDDSPTSLKLLSDILKAEGYKVRPSPNGELALAAAALHPPELVLLDVNMPGMNGFEVCKRLKARAETRETPIVFVSALSDTVDKITGFELGGVDYVTKPYQRDELLARVRTHLELHRLRHRLEEIVQDRTAELEDANKRLRKSEAEFRRIVSTANDGIWVLGPDGVIVFVNARMAEMLGYEPQEVLGRRAIDFMFAEDIADHAIRMERRRHGISEQYERRFKRRGGETLWTIVSGAAGFDDDRQFVGNFAMITDITERKQHEEQIQLLLREVNHRVKNMLTVVQAIARHTAVSAEDFVEQFSARIHALAASHDLLVQSEWHGVGIEPLIRSQLAHFADLIGTRIVLDGPDLTLSPRASQSIGMAAHELSTNASKYGALSEANGCVNITWGILDDGESGDGFSLCWVESDGPPIKTFGRCGFGQKLLVDVPQLELGASVQLEYAPTGLRWKLACCASKVLAPTASRPHTPRAAQQAFCA